MSRLTRLPDRIQDPQVPCKTRFWRFEPFPEVKIRQKLRSHRTLLANWSYGALVGLSSDVKCQRMRRSILMVSKPPPWYRARHPFGEMVICPVWVFALNGSCCRNLSCLSTQITSKQARTWWSPKHTQESLPLGSLAVVRRHSRLLIFLSCWHMQEMPLQLGPFWGSSDQGKVTFRDRKLT